MLHIFQGQEISPTRIVFRAAPPIGLSPTHPTIQHIGICYQPHGLILACQDAAYGILAFHPAKPYIGCRNNPREPLRTSV